MGVVPIQNDKVDDPNPKKIVVITCELAYSLNKTLFTLKVCVYVCFVLCRPMQTLSVNTIICCHRTILEV